MKVNTVAVFGYGTWQWGCSVSQGLTPISQGSWLALGRDGRLQERELEAWAAHILPAAVPESQPWLGSYTAFRGGCLSS